jgi:hypothetical protein
MLEAGGGWPLALPTPTVAVTSAGQPLHQYFFFCTGKASKLRYLAA